MNDNEAVVRIVGDATTVAPAVESAKGEVAGLGETLQALNVTMRDMVSQLTAGFAEINAQLAGTKDEMAAVEHETEKEALSLREVGERMKETALSVHEGVESFNRFKGAIREAIETYAIFFGIDRIKEMAEHMGEAAEQTEHLAQRFGITTQQVQQLQAVSIGTGVSFESMTRGMTMLDRAAELTPEKFQKLGISVQAGEGQMKLLLDTADRFKDMPDGPTKTAAAMELMGRQGAEMIPILDQGAEGLQKLIEKGAEYGVVNKAATASGVELAESVNEGKLAYAGLQQTLTQAFAPLLTEIIDGFNGIVAAMTASYQSGGAVKVIFEAITEVVEGFGEIFNSVGDALKEIFTGTGENAASWSTILKECIDAVVGAVKLFIVIIAAMVSGFKIAVEEIVGYAIKWYGDVREQFENAELAIDVLKIAFRTLGEVAEDALSLRWDRINADWDAGMAQIDATVRTRGAQIAADAKAARDQAAGWLTGATADEAQLEAYLANAAKPHAKPKRTGIEGGGGTGETPDLSKKKKERKPKDDLVQQLDEELSSRKLAWAMEQDAQGTAQEYSLQSEADYWKAILDRTDLSTKDRGEIEKKYLAVHSEIVKQRWQIEEDGYKQQLAEADKNEAEKLALAQRHLAEVGRMFGLESKEYAAAQAEIVKIKKAAEDQKRQLEQLSAEASDKAALAAIDAEETLAKHRVAMGVETNDRLLAQERQFEDQRYAIQLAAAQRARAAVDPSRDPVKYAQANEQIEALERSHQAKLTQIDQQAQLQRTAVERTAVNSTAQLWGQNIAKMLTMQQGFAATVQSLYKGMVDIIATALTSVVEKWLEQQIAALLFKRTAQSADGAATVTSNAAVAASAAFASTAAIPLVGPELAPAAAAAAFSATMAFAPIASAQGGWWQVPIDGAMTELHKDEMVLPSNLAGPLRSLVSRPAANANAPAPANDGGAGSFHYHDHSGTLTPDQIIANRAAVAKAWKKADEEGHFKNWRPSGQRR